MNRFYLVFVGLFLLLTEGISAKVRILTFHYNKPDFIELQHRCLQKFMLDEYELIVFNDAATEENERAIRETCESLGIECVRFQPKWHLTSPLNWKIKQWLKSPTTYQLHDHFPSKSCSLETTHKLLLHCYKQNEEDLLGYFPLSLPCNN